MAETLKFKVGDKVCLKDYRTKRELLRAGVLSDTTYMHSQFKIEEYIEGSESFKVSLVDGSVSFMLDYNSLKKDEFTPEVGDKITIKNAISHYKSYGDNVVAKAEHSALKDKIVTISWVDPNSRTFKIEQPEHTMAIGRDYSLTVFSYDMVKKSSLKKQKLPTTKSMKLPSKKIGVDEIIGQDTNKKMLEVAIEEDMPVLLVGETGTGKTSIIREQAINRKAEWTRFNLTGETTVDEFVGKYELIGGKTVWKPGILIQAMQKGEWLIVDEINVALPEILFVLHSLLDDDKMIVVSSHEGEKIKPHKDFRFFATMNPTDEYAGTKELNKAFQSRFNMVLILEYPNKTVESKIVADKTGVTEDNANKMADVAVALRQAKQNDNIFYTCSTRDLIQWGNLVDKLGMEDAFIVSVLNKANGDKPEIVKIYDKIMGRYIALEKEGLTLSIDWFELAARKLKDEKQKFESEKEETRKKITEEIVRKLTSEDVSAEKDSAQLEILDVDIKTTKEETELKSVPF